MNQNTNKLWKKILKYQIEMGGSGKHNPVHDLMTKSINLKKTNNVFSSKTSYRGTTNPQNTSRHIKHGSITKYEV